MTFVVTFRETGSVGRPGGMTWRAWCLVGRVGLWTWLGLVPGGPVDLVGRASLDLATLGLKVPCSTG